jgi:hypothetical protein
VNVTLKSVSLVLTGLLVILAGCARRVPPAVRASGGDVAALRTALGGGQAAGGATTVAAAEPTGFADFSGTIKISGTAPPRGTLKIDKEQDVCMPGGKPVLAEELVVDGNGGIKDVVIFLTTKYPAGDAKWEHPDHAAKASDTREFDQKNCIFLTHMLAMRSSQKLKIMNSDGIGHNTNIAATGKVNQFNQTIAGNSYAMYEPGGEAPEPFAVSCNIHPWMSARMIARNSPYFAVTDEKGSFVIEKVPAGVDLEFRVWQERCRFVPSATVDGKAMPGLKGRLKLKLDPDQPKKIEMVIDAAVFGK